MANIFLGVLVANKLEIDLHSTTYVFAIAMFIESMQTLLDAIGFVISSSKRLSKIAKRFGQTLSYPYLHSICRFRSNREAIQI